MPGLLNRMRERGYGPPQGGGAFGRAPQMGGSSGGMQMPPQFAPPPGTSQAPQSLLPRFTQPPQTPDTPNGPAYQGYPSLAQGAGLTEGHPSLYRAVMNNDYDGFMDGLAFSTLTPGGMIQARGGNLNMRNMLDPAGLFD